MHIQFIYVSVHVCLCVAICCTVCQCLQGSGQGRDYAAAGLTNGWKLPHVGTGDER